MIMRPALVLAACCLGGHAEEVTPAAEGCTITSKMCRNFPEFARKQFRDEVGEKHAGVGGNDAACVKRAEDFHHWCGNGANGPQVAATYNSQELTQVYHPGACQAGWSQWDAFCFKHFWEKKTWFEAEVICRAMGEGCHLASIHSRAENRFIFTLTNGLSAWIGYTDLDQDTHYKWSDNTQDDFSNFAKNCTGREHEPDCKPEEKAQQWYDWEGHDAGTYVCKRNALLPVAFLRNTSAKSLVTKPWAQLLPAFASSDESEEGVPPLTSSQSLPQLKVDEITKVPSETSRQSEAKPAVPEPRLGLPKSTFLR